MKQTQIIIKVVCNLRLSSMPRIYFSIILNELLQNMARYMEYVIALENHSRIVME